MLTVWFLCGRGQAVYLTHVHYTIVTQNVQRITVIPLMMYFLLLNAGNINLKKGSHPALILKY
jgi:hypothetical protein